MANNQVEMVHQDTTGIQIRDWSHAVTILQNNLNWKNLHPSPIYTLSFLSIPKLYYLTVGSCGPYCIELHDALCSVGLHLKRLVCRDTPPLPKHGLCNSDKHDENWKSKPCKPVRRIFWKITTRILFNYQFLYRTLGVWFSVDRG